MPKRLVRVLKVVPFFCSIFGFSFRREEIFIFVFGSRFIIMLSYNMTDAKLFSRVSISSFSESLRSEFTICSLRRIVPDSMCSCACVDCENVNMKKYIVNSRSMVTRIVRIV